MGLEPIACVSMPWHPVASPSIQLGLIQGIADREGVPCRSHSLHLQFLAALARGAPKGAPHLTAQDYRALADDWFGTGAAEWVFALPPVGPAGRRTEERYTRVLRARGMPAALRQRLLDLRRFVPGFLERCADEVLAARPAAVGFTITYAQRTPSLALARILKARDPAVRIVFGGAGCEDRMGPALLRAFPWVDLVVRGRIDGTAPDLLRALAGRVHPAGVPGVCWREGEQVIAAPAAADETPMNHLPIPAYDEFFERLKRSGLAGEIAPELPIETSRGCWWGAVSHCTFCGLNGSSMAYRGKSPERVLEEVRVLSRRHELLDFTAVDNILDLKYIGTLMPRLRDSGLDLNLFYEVKANLTFEQLRALRAAGVRRLQPGIESLSSSVLRSMKKGTTALHNVRLLKWCLQLGIEVYWNLLYGLPGEDPDAYRRMADLVPSLIHLPAPRLVRVEVDRFSPLHRDPAGHGVRLLGPAPGMAFLLDVEPALLEDLTTSFAHEHLDGRDPEAYVAPLRAALRDWQCSARAGGSRLSYRRGPGFLTIIDRRRGLQPARYTLTQAEAAVYLACTAGATPAQARGMVAADLGRDVDEGEIRCVLDALLDERLVFQEDDRYLSLATPAAEDVGPARPAPAAACAAAAADR